MDSFRDLIVWQKGMLIVEAAYRWTRTFPREELYGLSDQMRRAAISVPSNIAEGYGRQSTPDYIRFLLIARGSLL
ncbi:MAG: four helix bundle protein [Prosthecobacter sp.]|uniref:four helix bundle protein n=1 Tax=Prosthecobacter sp. TaxID=1965333 RepID=UPI0038FEBE55